MPDQYLPLPFPLLYIRFLPGIPYERRIKTEHVIVIHQVTAADFMDAADAVGDAVAVDMEFVADFLNIAVQPYIGYGRIGQLGVSALCDKKGKGVLQSGNGGFRQRNCQLHLLKAVEMLVWKQYFTQLKAFKGSLIRCVKVGAAGTDAGMAVMSGGNYTVIFLFKMLILLQDNQVLVLGEGKQDITIV